jgi:hypothetical protein
LTTLLLQALTALYTVPLLESLVLAVVIRAKRVVLLQGVPHGNSVDYLLLNNGVRLMQMIDDDVCAHLLSLALATPSSLVCSPRVRLKSIDVFVQYHRRRLDLLAPSMTGLGIRLCRGECRFRKFWRSVHNRVRRDKRRRRGGVVARKNRNGGSDRDTRGGRSSFRLASATDGAEGKGSGPPFKAGIERKYSINGFHHARLPREIRESGTG